VEELLRHDYEVVNLDVAAPKEERCPFTQIDLTDFGQTIEAFSEIDARYRGVDAIVHLAAIPGPGMRSNAATFQNNTVSSYNVLAAARNLGVKNLVWASSETLLGLPFEVPRRMFLWTKVPCPPRDCLRCQTDGGGNGEAVLPLGS
jgi:nucleoside-diphosphate-sugar epimerase